MCREKESFRVPGGGGCVGGSLAPHGKIGEDLVDGGWSRLIFWMRSTKLTELCAAVECVCRERRLAPFNVGARRKSAPPIFPLFRRAKGQSERATSRPFGRPFREVIIAGS